MILVKFTKNWRNYFANDVAGWDDDYATRLVEELQVAKYAVEKEEGETSPPDVEHDEQKDALTLTKFMRLDAEHLVQLAKEKGIDLEGREMKKDTQPFLRVILFPETVKKDDAE